MTRPIIHCADAIVRYSGAFIVIERLNDGGKLALVGGKQEPGDTLISTIIKEVFEETGLCFQMTSVMKTYAEDDRDPRGHFISTVFVGHGIGAPKDETGKTRVRLMDRAEIEANYSSFAFDHAQVFRDYFLLYH